MAKVDPSWGPQTIISVGFEFKSFIVNLNPNNIIACGGDSRF